MFDMTMQFPGKAKPTETKLRGGYYTPQPVARFLAEWVSKTGSRTLEPSAGDGAILAELSTRSIPTAVELLSEEAKKAQAATGVEVHVGDFFTWFTKDRQGTFDGVAGNPPYIRFGNWDEKYRTSAFSLMENVGLKPTRLTNAWLPFVVASVLAVRSGGRVGLVLPAEFLQVDYAKQIRTFLIDNCSDVKIVSFSDLIFPGILQEVVLLLAIRGEGPAQMRGIEVSDASKLETIKLDIAAVQAPLHEDEKWTKYYLDPPQVERLRRLRTDPRLTRVGDHAAVNVGVVTGRNSFFCMSEEQARERGLFDHTMGLLARSASLVGTTFTEHDLQKAETKGLNSRLLAVDQNYDATDDRALLEYIQLGEEEEVHLGYKCSIRRPWWYVPSTQVPAGFMLRQISTLLKVASNHVGATSTDTVHRVFTKPGVNMDKLAVASFNSVTMAFSEILGRSYGGGLLEMEPREAVQLPIPDPEIVPDELVSEVDSLLREGRQQEAVELMDQKVMIERAGMAEDELLDVRRAHQRLMKRRLRRGKK